MSKLVKPPASAYSKPSSKRKGSEWYFFLQIMCLIIIAILVLLVAARGGGWDKLTSEPNMIAMINDDGAIVRAIVMLGAFALLLFAVGKPAHRASGFVKLDRVVATVVFVGIMGLMYWFAWGGGYIP